MNTEAKSRALPRRNFTHFPQAASPGLRLRFIVGAIVMTLAGTTQALAHGQIRRQIDPATGIVTYIYRPSPADRNIKAASLPVPHQMPDKRPSPITVSAREKPQMKPVPAEEIASPSYREFPRVSAATQKARDSERRRILKHELAWEQAALDQAIENKDASEVLRRHRENIESLHREISNVQ